MCIRAGFRSITRIALLDLAAGWTPGSLTGQVPAQQNPELPQIPQRQGSEHSALLSGIVKDEQGNVIPFAKVTIKSLETGLEKTVQADGDGRFATPQLPPGKYAISATAQGFGIEQRFIN